jgi:phenylacetate-CoA ligase
VAEFRAIVRQEGALTQVALEIEPAATGNGAAVGAAGVQNLLERIGRAVQESLHFRCDVAAVPPGTLPRFKMKAKRFVRLNGDGAGQ